MKRKFSLFTLVAIVAAFFAVSCGTNGGSSCTADATKFNGTYRGSHKVYIGGVDASTIPGANLSPISDALTITSASTTRSHIVSDSIGIVLNGTADASNCNLVALDSFIQNTGDTLFVPSGSFGTVKIWGVRAGGTGTLNSNTITTSLKIAKGKTNITLLGLNDLNGKNLELRGTFTK